MNVTTTNRRKAILASAGTIALTAGLLGLAAPASAGPAPGPGPGDIGSNTDSAPWLECDDYKSEPREWCTVWDKNGIKKFTVTRVSGATMNVGGICTAGSHFHHEILGGSNRVESVQVTDCKGITRTVTPIQPG